MNASRIFLSGLAAAGLMAAVSTPAHAVLQIAADVSGTPFFCADNTGCDLNLATGTIQLANDTLNGVAVNGSIQLSTGTPANPGQDLIDTSSLSIINTAGATRVVTVAVSDTDFSAPVGSFHLTGSGTWVNAGGSSLLLQWWDDPLNAQGADNAFDAPGVKLGEFTSLGIDPLHSFSFDEHRSGVRQRPILDDHLGAGHLDLRGSVAQSRPGGGQARHSGTFDLGDDGAWFRRPWLCRLSPHKKGPDFGSRLRLRLFFHNPGGRLWAAFFFALRFPAEAAVGELGFASCAARSRSSERPSSPRFRPSPFGDTITGKADRHYTHGGIIRHLPRSVVDMEVVYIRNSFRMGRRLRGIYARGGRPRTLHALAHR